MNQVSGVMSVNHALTTIAIGEKIILFCIDPIQVIRKIVVIHELVSKIQGFSVKLSPKIQLEFEKFIVSYLLKLSSPLESRHQCF
jgi:hypothetical protein